MFPGPRRGRVVDAQGLAVNLIPVADALLSLAVASYQDGQMVAPHEAVPNYVRDRVTS